MQCELVEKHLDAYVDEELDAGTVVLFENHLSQCRSCQTRLAFTRSIKRQVKEQFSTVSAPESLSTRVRAELAKEPNEPTEGQGRYTHKAVFGMSAAATVAFAIFGAYQAFEGQFKNGSTVAESSMAIPVFEDVVDRHTQDHLLDVQDTEPDRATSWFRGKVRFPVRPVQFRDPSVRFVGARLSHVRERQAAALYYNISGRKLTTVMFEAPSPLWSGCERAVISGRELYYRNVFGYTVPVIQHNNIAYAFTSDLDRSSLLRVVANAKVP